MKIPHGNLGRGAASQVNSDHNDSRRILLIDWYYGPLLNVLRSSKKRGESFDSLSRGLGIGPHYAMKDELEKLGWHVDFLAVNSLHSCSDFMKRFFRLSNSLSAMALWVVLGISRVFSKVSIHQRLWPVVAARLIQMADADVAYVHYPGILGKKELRHVRASGTVTVLQHSAFRPELELLRHYDGFVSCLNRFAEYAREAGVSALHLAHGVNVEAVRDVQVSERDIDVSFVGSVTQAHPITIPLLRAVAQEVPTLKIFSPEAEVVLADDVLAPLYSGQVWGSDMFEVLVRSKVTLNRHGEVAEDEAANIRLFEATACGAALVTDQKSNISDFFEPGKEIEVYENPQDAANLVVGLLSDPARLASLAMQGQRRTLEHHSIGSRMAVLSAFLNELVETKD